jgi:L-ascorbate metabolism protein UlaG (beta-lactamase superfamily)
MKVTKLTHACLLIETEDDVTLFDPGEMSFAANLLDIAAMPRLDRIVITHAHSDHYSEEFVLELVAKFPDVRIVTTAEMVAKLKEKGIKAQSTADDMTEIFEAPHESMVPLAPLPMAQNIGVHYKGLLSHPGDSHHFSDTKGILALPFDGPWGSTAYAAQLATELKPKVVLPIHDWMWTEAWKSDFYDWLEGYFKSVGITFIKLVDGESVEL